MTKKPEFGASMLALAIGVAAVVPGLAQESGDVIDMQSMTVPAKQFHGDTSYYKRRVTAEWQPYFSDSGDRTEGTCAQGVVNALRCHPDDWYCARMTISCNSNVPVGKMPHTWSLAFSEENSGRHICRDGEFVAGLKCSGPWCDNLQVKCRPVLLPMMTKADAKATGVDFAALGYELADKRVCKTYRNLANASDGRSAMRENPDAFIKSIACKGNYCQRKDVQLCLLRTHPEVGESMRITSNWTELKSCIGCPKISESATVGLQTTNSESNTLGWAASVTASFKVTAGGDALGGSLESGLAATFGGNGSKTLVKTVTGGSSKTTASDCAPLPGDTGVSHLALWQYGFAMDRTTCADGDCSVEFGTDKLLCLRSEAGNILKPKCVPDDCMDANCQTCRTTY